MTYSNPLAGKLGLGDDDIKHEGKLLRLCADLAAKILIAIPNAPFQWHVFEPAVTAQEAVGANWRTWPPFGPRCVWAKSQGHTWFAAEVKVPEAARGRTLVLRFASQWQERPGSTDPQCLAYLDGEIVQAIDGNHTELVVTREAVPGTSRVLHVDAFTFYDRPLVGFDVELLIRNERAEKLYYDLVTPLEVAIRLHQCDPRRHAVLHLVDLALRALDRRDGYTPAFEASLGDAERIASRIYDLVDTEVQPRITAVGHTHLDVGWLWRVAHTRDKTARSFATALSLMAEYPRFIFMYNQAVLLDFLKSDYPELWQRMRERVAMRQFEIEGAFWVEPDVNIVSGESLVRQIMRGRRFHIEQFGITPKAVWLPDTFGYSANLPQIMARSGLEHFVTSKLSWNDTNRQPYDTFFWRGIDGTTTKAQLITAQPYESEEIYTTYNSDLSVSQVMGAWKRYEPKSANDEVLLCYGFGDGGGGPTRAMIERGIRMERGIPGAPKVKLEGITPFLERLSARMDAERKRFPVWNGELYLEYHRGTLTSVAKNKANNRRVERLLREVEYLAAMALVTDRTPYPAEQLARAWDLAMVNQFHDILPGTSIPEVYADSDNDYALLFSILASANGPWHAAADAFARPPKGGLRLLNFTGQERSELVALGDDPALDGTSLATAGSIEPVQNLVGAGGEATYAAPVRNLAALGWTSAAVVTAADREADTALSVSPTHLENELIRVVFDASGEITSIVDKACGREVLAAGETGNRLIAFEDKPMQWDAWDIDRYFEEQFWPLADGPASTSVAETGPHRAAIRFERAYRTSRIVQVVSLAAGARQVEFDTFIDWQERQTVLKACFPFDLNVSEIRAEIQFGHVKRATHRNTTWDRARFEASMHRWVDMSEADFGVALINDCKYGYDAVEQLVRLTLLRGSIFPDPDADLGEHRLRYALLVHRGVEDLAEVQRAAERFNNPIAVLGRPEALAASPNVDARFSFASTDAANVTLETVKKAEGSDAIVLRAFEHANIRAVVTISFGIPVKSVRAVNLMEEDAGPPLPLVENGVTLTLRPFEIATLLIEPA